MSMAASISELEDPLLGEYGTEQEAIDAWAAAMINFFLGMDRLPGTDSIIQGFESAIKGQMVGLSNPGGDPPPPPPQGPLKLQAGFAQAWVGISASAASLYAGAASATPPPAVATIATVVLPAVFPLNSVPGVTKQQAATTTAAALGGANATGGLWVLSVGGTVPIT